MVLRRQRTNSRKTVRPGYRGTKPPPRRTIIKDGDSLSGSGRMHKLATTRGWKAITGASLLALAFAWAPGSGAQVSDYGQKQAGPVRDEAPQLLKKVAILQKLNTQVPLNLAFR